MDKNYFDSVCYNSDLILSKNFEKFCYLNWIKLSLGWIRLGIMCPSDKG